MKLFVYVILSVILICSAVAVRVYLYYKDLVKGRYVVLERLNNIPETTYSLISSISVYNNDNIRPVGATSNIPYNFPLTSDAMNVIDNNSDTSAKYNDWIQIDLGKDIGIKEITIVKHKNNTFDIAGSRIRIVNEEGKDVYTSKEIKLGSTIDENVETIKI